MYDQIIGKLVEVPITISQRFSPLQATTGAMRSQSEPIVTTTKELKSIRGGVELAIVPCTLSLPIESMRNNIVVVSTQVEKLEELATLKPIPLAIPNIGVGAKVTQINTITHAFEVF